MIIYIKDIITNEIIARSCDLSVVYGKELIFGKQKSVKEIANNLSDSILFLVHREAKHFISYSAELDQSIIILNRNLIAIIMENLNEEYDVKLLEYQNQLNKFKYDTENFKNNTR